MHFDQLSRMVVHLLIKSHCCFTGVNLFHASRNSSLPPDDVNPVPPPAVGQCLPLWKLLFSLLARTHTYPTPVFAITQLCVRHGMAPIRLAEYGVIVESLALMISH